MPRHWPFKHLTRIAQREEQGEDRKHEEREEGVEEG